MKPKGKMKLKEILSVLALDVAVLAVAISPVVIIGYSTIHSEKYQQQVKERKLSFEKRRAKEYELFFKVFGNSEKGLADVNNDGLSLGEIEDAYRRMGIKLKFTQDYTRPYKLFFNSEFVHTITVSECSERNVLTIEDLEKAVQSYEAEKVKIKDH